MQTTPEIWVRFLSWEDPLGEGTETHSSILAWRILWTEAPGWLQSIGRKESDMTEVTEHSTIQVSLILRKIFFSKYQEVYYLENKNAKVFNEFAAWIVNIDSSIHVMYI